MCYWFGLLTLVASCVFVLMISMAGCLLYGCFDNSVGMLLGVPCLLVLLYGCVVVWLLGVMWVVVIGVIEYSLIVCGSVCIVHGLFACVFAGLGLCGWLYCCLLWLW